MSSIAEQGGASVERARTSAFSQSSADVRGGEVPSTRNKTDLTPSPPRTPASYTEIGALSLSVSPVRLPCRARHTPRMDSTRDEAPFTAVRTALPYPGWHRGDTDPFMCGCNVAP